MHRGDRLVDKTVNLNVDRQGVKDSPAAPESALTIGDALVRRRQNKCFTFSLILRSARGRRLEGWMHGIDLLPSFVTHCFACSSG